MSEIYGSFFLGLTEFALSVSHVQEVVNTPLSYTPVPLSPPYLRGLFNLRGAIIPIVDLHHILKLTPSEKNETQKIAIVEYGGLFIGLLFDRTGEIFRDRPEERSDFNQASSEHSVIKGVFKKSAERIIQILDTDALFSLQNIPKQNSESMNGRVGAHWLKRKGSRNQCISFVVGPARCALGIDAIQEILKVGSCGETALAGRNCIGAIDLRGATIPLIDFPALLGYRQPDTSPDAVAGDRRVIVLRSGTERFGLLVDAVESIVSYFNEELVQFPTLNTDRADLFKGCITREGESGILLFDQTKILSSDEINEITRGHSKLYQAATERHEDKLKAKSSRRTFITFSLEGTFAVGIDEVREVIDDPRELMQPPGLAKHFRGVLNLRGELITIVNTREMYAMTSNPAAQPKVLVFKNGSASFGLTVDAIDSIVSFNDHERVDLPEILYKNDPNRMMEDVREAVEVKDGDQRKCLLILNLTSIAQRLTRRAA